MVLPAKFLAAQTLLYMLAMEFEMIESVKNKPSSVSESEVGRIGLLLSSQVSLRLEFGGVGVVLRIEADSTDVGDDGSSLGNVPSTVHIVRACSMSRSCCNISKWPSSSKHKITYQEGQWARYGRLQSTKRRCRAS